MGEWKRILKDRQASGKGCWDRDSDPFTIQYHWASIGARKVLHSSGAIPLLSHSWDQWQLNLVDMLVIWLPGWLAEVIAQEQGLQTGFISGTYKHLLHLEQVTSTKV